MYRPRLIRSRSVVGALAGVMFLAACTQQGGDAPKNDARQATDYRIGYVGDQRTPDTPVEGGTLTFADYTEARSLDPTKTVAHGAAGGSAMAAVYDLLVRYDHETGEYRPWLAESIESDEEHKTWTLKLREGVKFSDGAALDAKAVVASIDRYIKERGSDSLLLSTNIEKMEAADGTTVVFRMRDAWASFPSMLAQGAGMVVAPSATEGAKFTPVGAGPFTLAEYAPQEEMVLRSRKDYWNGAPHLAQLRFVWLQNDDAKLSALRSGSVDMTFMRSPAAIAASVKANLPGFMDLTSLGNVLQINNREGRPGADPRVRQAIAYALDPEVVIQRAYDGLGLPGKGLFHTKSKWRTGVEPLPYDLAKAKELVAQAKADGFDGELTYMGNAAPASRTEALAVKAMLEAAGFTVEFDFQRSVADQTKKMYTDHDFDLAKGSNSLSDSDPYQRLSNSLSSRSPLNAVGYADPEMDALITELQKADSDEGKTEALTEIERLWQQKVPAVSLGADTVLASWNTGVHGVQPGSEQIFLFGQAWKSE